MPRGEWLSNVDIELKSMANEVRTFDKGTSFTILDTDGTYVVLAQKGIEDMVIIKIEDFHQHFDPHWRKSENMVFKNNEAV